MKHLFGCRNIVLLTEIKLWPSRASNIISFLAPSHPSRLNIDVGVFDVGERAASVCLLPHAQFPIPGQPFFTKYDALSSCFSRARNKSESQFSCLFLFFVRAGLDVASFCSWQLKNISRKKVGRVCLHCLSQTRVQCTCTDYTYILHFVWKSKTPRFIWFKIDDQWF